MMLKGHFDGDKIVLDEPMPAGVAPNTPVRIVIGNGQQASLFDRLLDLAVDDDGLPADYAEQHEHYVKGTPKR
ncbi:MAG: hypothetical protein IT431_02735 [Phycisphaerales bacterium]|nr:hypothetical protein [Phycisphaerales bacterium]